MRRPRPSRTHAAASLLQADLALSQPRTLFFFLFPPLTNQVRDVDNRQQRFLLPGRTYPLYLPSMIRVIFGSEPLSTKQHHSSCRRELSYKLLQYKTLNFYLEVWRLPIPVQKI